LDARSPTSLTNQSATSAVNSQSKEKTMAFGWLKTIGKDVKAVFAFLGSSNGQKIITGVETAGLATATAFGVGAPVAAGINLINVWMGEAIKSETLAAAAGSQDGTGAQKSAMVLQAMVPQLMQFLQGQGLTPQQVTDKATAINTQVVNLLNLLDAPADSSTATPAIVPPATL
jgi:hypothetical protein